MHPDSYTILNYCWDFLSEVWSLRAVYKHSNYWGKNNTVIGKAYFLLGGGYECIKLIKLMVVTHESLEASH